MKTKEQIEKRLKEIESDERMLYSFRLKEKSDTLKWVLRGKE